MPRNRLLDCMQSHRFWLVDAVPSGALPFFVLGAPVMGFQTVSAPEVSLEADQITQLNSMWKRPAYSGGSVSPITLTRGVRGYDNTFWTWVQRALLGSEQTPRNLLLIHFTSINVVNELGLSVELPMPMEAWESAGFVPGKAWILWESIPTRYKAASDFDASDGSVSIAELELQPYAITELALLAP